METYQKTFNIGGIEVYKTYTSIDNLKPDPQNPRDITDDKLDDLIDFLNKYGTFKPVLTDFRTETLGQLIGGNKRLEAYKKMGITEVWIEPRVPGSDAEAFEMGTLDNMAFGYYVEDKLKEEIRRHEDELGEDIEKLEAALQAPVPFDDILKPKNSGKMKFEIVVKCADEHDLMQKLSKLNELGITGKKRGK